MSENTLFANSPREALIQSVVDYYDATVDDVRPLVDTFDDRTIELLFRCLRETVINSVCNKYCLIQETVLTKSGRRYLQKQLENNVSKIVNSSFVIEYEVMRNLAAMVAAQPGLLSDDHKTMICIRQKKQARSCISIFTGESTYNDMIQELYEEIQNGDDPIDLAEIKRQSVPRRHNWRTTIYNYTDNIQILSMARHTLKGELVAIFLKMPVILLWFVWMAATIIAGKINTVIYPLFALMPSVLYLYCIKREPCFSYPDDAATVKRELVWFCFIKWATAISGIGLIVRSITGIISAIL